MGKETIRKQRNMWSNFKYWKCYEDKEGQHLKSEKGYYFIQIRSEKVCLRGWHLQRSERNEEVILQHVYEDLGQRKSNYKNTEAGMSLECSRNNNEVQCGWRRIRRNGRWGHRDSQASDYKGHCGSG